MTKIATDTDLVVDIDYDRLFVERHGIDGGLMTLIVWCLGGDIDILTSANTELEISKLTKSELKSKLNCNHILMR